MTDNNFKDYKMDTQENSEVQLFVIWEKGRYAEKEIIEDIKSNFEIIHMFSITWSPYLVSTNFSRFYDAKLPRNSQKELHAGIGEFKLIVVRDNNPNYDFRETSKGKFFVNTKMFDSKSKYRELTGGGHKIHCTNDKIELKHDLVMLLGISLSDFLKKYGAPENESSHSILAQDLPGATGWNSFEDLFYVLNECGDYVVLRNSETVNLQYFKENNGDVDLLVKDRIRFLYLLGDLSSIESEFLCHSKVSIDNEVILFELYDLGQNVFHSSFQNHLLKSAVKRNGMNCLPFELEFYALVYHALLFHEKLSVKHEKRIKTFIDKNEKLDDLVVSQRSLFILLQEYFVKHNCFFMAPNDYSIYFNFELVKGSDLLIKNKKRLSKLSVYLRKIIQFKSLNNYSKIILFAFLKNVFEIIFNIRIRRTIREIRIGIGNK